MSHRRPVAAAVATIALLVLGSAASAATPHRGALTMGVAAGERLRLALPAGWGARTPSHGLVTLVSRSTCHTATVSAFVDHGSGTPRDRAQRLLGYMAGREYDAGRLWQGASGHGPSAGYTVYDPVALLGIKAMPHHRRTVVVIVHGLRVSRGRCSARVEGQVGRQLSELLQHLRLVGDTGPVVTLSPRLTA